MSIDYNVHVGAYIRVWTTVTRTEVDLCADHEHGGGAFCSECGRPSKRRMKAEETRPDDGYYEAHMDERLCPWDVGDLYDEGRRTYVMVENGVDTTGLHIDPKYDDSAEQAMPDEATCEANFKERYAKEIAWLVAHDCEVEVRFGVLSWSY